MRILTNVSKAELDYLTTQPTAKKMIEKVKAEGIFIPEGDAAAAADFVAMRNRQKQEASLKISDEGMAALKKDNEAKETQVTSEKKDSREDQIREKIAELKKELSELKSKHPTDEKAKEALKQKKNAIMQQIDTLTMQLLQIQKRNSESNS